MVTIDTITHGPYKISVTRRDKTIIRLDLHGEDTTVAVVHPTIKAITFLRHAADLIDQMLAFDGCERPVTKEDA